MKLIFTSAAQRDHSNYTKWLIRRMDKVIATSEKAGKYLEVPHDVVMHGIDTEIYVPTRNKKSVRAELGLPEGQLVGCFGRVRYQKGIDIFVKSMVKICKLHPNVYGIICGKVTSDNQNYTDDLKHLIKAEGLEQRILFLGELPTENLPLLFRSLDVYIAPQRWEGFGLTPIEAMSSGVPVIATKAGVFEEMILPNQTGYIVDYNDIDTISKHLSNLLSNEDLLNKMSEQARARVVNAFNIQKEAKRLIDIYQQISA
jgi:mannosyltransferase